MSLTKEASKYLPTQEEIEKEAREIPGNVGQFQMPPQQDQGRNISRNSATNFSMAVRSGRSTPKEGAMQTIHDITQYQDGPGNFSATVLHGHNVREVGP